jgi:hypothetical protein
MPVFRSPEDLIPTLELALSLLEAYYIGPSKVKTTEAMREVLDDLKKKVTHP